MSDEIKAHGELLDDGSYHCLLKWSNGVECHMIEWDRAAFLWHVKNDHMITDEIVIDGEPEPIVHRGSMHDRVEGEKCNYHSCLREKAFADAWEQAQRDDQILAHLSTQPAAPREPGAWQAMPSGLVDEWHKHSWACADDAETYTQRDAIVAATVIQWLGTNVGFCWLEETLRKAGYVVGRRPDAGDEAKAYAQVRREIEAQQGAETRPGTS